MLVAATHADVPTVFQSWCTISADVVVPNSEAFMLVLHSPLELGLYTVSCNIGPTCTCWRREFLGLPECKIFAAQERAGHKCAATIKALLGIVYNMGL